MQGYIIRRLLLIIPTLFLLGTILFMMLQFIPGDVASTLLASEENAASPEAIEKLRGELGLKDPLYVQYVNGGSRVLARNHHSAGAGALCRMGAARAAC